MRYLLLILFFTLQTFGFGAKAIDLQKSDVKKVLTLEKSNLKEPSYYQFRYYNPDSGQYISQDPIGLQSGEPNLYAYVNDINSWVDPFGLSKTPTSTLQSLWKNYTGSKHPFRDIHHGFPEEFADKFKGLADINVNNPKYHYNLPVEKHTKIPGIHTNSSRTGQNWNKTWKGLIEQVETMNLSKSENKEIFEKLLRGLARKERIGKYNTDAIKNRKVCP